MSDRSDAIHPRKQPGRAAMSLPANSPDVYRFLSVLARVTRRIAEQEQSKERAG